MGGKGFSTPPPILIPGHIKGYKMKDVTPIKQVDKSKLTLIEQKELEEDNGSSNKG